MVIQKCREFNKDLYMCFIDYSKAFNCMAHNKLWETLKEMAFPIQEIKLIRELYKDQQSTVHTNCGTTDWFPVERGVRQGCILSPYLFNVYTESIMSDVDKDGNNGKFNELNIHRHRIKDLRYTDDTSLLSHTPSGLTCLINSVKTHSEEKNLNLNVKKTKVMKTNRTSEIPIIKINGETLENVHSYEYLGSTITDNSDGTKEVKKQLAMASNKLSQMKNLWKGEDKQTKIRILRACIFPTATYGCETWTIKKAVTKALNTFEIKCYRRMLRISWMEHRTNQSILEELNIGERWLEIFARKQKLKYFGHLKRHNGLGKTIMEGIVNGKRMAGRPRRQWERDVQEALSRTTTAAGRLAMDRECFWKEVRGATFIRISS